MRERERTSDLIIQRISSLRARASLVRPPRFGFGARANAALPPLDAGSRPRACDAPCECARRRERGALWTTDDDAGRFCSLSRFEIKISRALDGDYTYYYAACLEKFLDCFGLLGRQYFETNWQCK